MSFDDLIHYMGDRDELYGEAAWLTDGDTATVETPARSTPVKFIGADTPKNRSS